MARPTMMPPYLYTCGRDPAMMPLSMMEAVAYGMSTPITTSRVVQSGVRSAAALYCLTCLNRVRNIVAGRIIISVCLQDSHFL